MEPFLTGNRLTGLKDAVHSARSMSGVALEIGRFVSFTGGNTALGKAPTRNNTIIKTIGRAYQLTQKDVLDSGGIYQLGDIRTKTIIDIVGYDNPATNQTQGDDLKYDGNNYRIVGKPRKVYAAGGRVETIAFWSKKQ